MRACLLHDEGEHAKALRSWRQLIDQWTNVPIQAAFSISRYGQMSAAALGDWATVAQMALYGESVATERDFMVTAIGFRADEALALWKSGAAADSIVTFASVLDSFECLPDPETDLASHTLQRLVGHAIGWVRREVTGGSSDFDYLEPPPARFSSLEIDERIRELTIESPIGLWWMLAEVEGRLQLGKLFTAVGR